MLIRKSKIDDLSSLTAEEEYFVMLCWQVNPDEQL